MQISKIKQISLAVCLVLTPLSVYAAGLGKLNTQSALGEPLRAEIEVIATPEEIASIAASIASEEAFAAQGVTRLGIHNQIKIDLAKSANGKSVLKLRSAEPIKDPFLDLIIQMDWTGGQLQREYTVLLDPPTYKATEVNGDAVAVASPTARAMSDVDSSSTVAKKVSTKKVKKYKKRADATPKVDVDVAADAQSTTTKSGDSLSAIAKELQVEGVSLDQMLAGLYQANPDAFIKGNINRLKIGQIIKVPTKESLAAIDNNQAKQIVKVHSANWNAYRNNMAKVVASATVNSESEVKQTSSGKITTAEDKAAAIKAGPQDVVKLSAGDKNASSAEGKLTALQEEAVAREKSLKESQERAAQLEAQINDMKKVLELKNQAMADKQNVAANAAVSATQVVSVPEVKPTDVKVEVPATSPTETAPTTVSATTTVVEPAPEVKVEEVKPVPVASEKPHVVEPPAPDEEPGFLAGILGGDNNLPLIGGGVGLALLGAGWMFLRNKRKKNLDSFERGILTSGGLRANTVFGNTTSNTSTSDTSFLTDFAQSVDGGMIDTNDVDPIAEAEVYMAYGRGAQAEEILKDAISKEPKRYELHLKLLEIYVENKDAASFETIAGELYTTLGADDPVWAKVATLGAKLEPDNPLYDLSKVAVTTAATAQLADSNIDLSQLDTPESNEEKTEELVADDNGLDFSFDDEPTSETESNETALSASDDSSSQEINFAEFETDDVLDIGSTVVDEQVPSTEVKPQAEESNMMDFDLGELLDIGEPRTDDVTAESDVSHLLEEMPPLDLTLPEKNTFSSDVDTHTIAADAAPVEALDFTMDFDLPSISTGNEPVSAEDHISEGEQKSSFSTDFSFDLPNDEPLDLSLDDNAAANDLPVVDEPIAPHTFDLSSISLDLDTPTIQPAAEFEGVNIGAAVKSEIESPDVEIKLDLVAVYMDMDDKIGARELLEEVMKEGGANQKERAQKLLDSMA